ncbi:protein LYK5-like [Iris pallida]|uniref:Protein LYK5-like n=1 Tax=Iris pallida TaxID=29817 RepID=A0AAX6DN60_IRIPA|nr:protein LYK5-like [Iris pallida]
MERKKKKSMTMILVIAAVCISSLSSSVAQQPFLNNLQFNCSSNGPSTLGYSCNGAHTSCSTYLTFRSSAPSYQSPALISYLLNTNASALADLNRVPDVSPIPAGDLVLVPASCSCSGPYYQHNATYTIKALGEIYLLVANDTYQGLSTCQALIAQNPYDPLHLTKGMDLLVPLRCACPTDNQTALGVKYLLNYLITPGDTVPDIARRFSADYHSVLLANDLDQDTVIFPYNSLLLPLKTEPTLAQISAPPPPPPAPSPSPPPPPTDRGSGTSSKNNNTGVFVGVGVGAAFLVLLSGLLSWYFCCFRGRRRERRSALPVAASAEDSNAYGGGGGEKISPSTTTTTPFKSNEIRTFLDSLVVYEFEDLERATGRFAEENRIGGSVYRGTINGDDAAVKRLKGDYVPSEIGILKQINHSSVVRLSGLCVHEGSTYLVYEFVERGSLSDWLHRRRSSREDRTTADSAVLSWKQRVRIAYDVADGLNYLHHYTSPPYVHKNVKSSNVLLDAEFRAKLANFGLARAVEEYGDGGGGLQLTRHVVGTHGYMAPEYLEHGLITPKLDVFAFGVVLLELLSGREATYPKDDEDEKEKERGELLLSGSLRKVLSGGGGGGGDDVRTKLRGFVDPCLRNEYPFDLALAMAELAVRCVAREAGSRPSMTDVLMTLSAIYNSTLDWDPSEVRNPDSMVHGRGC